MQSSNFLIEPHREEMNAEKAVVGLPASAGEIWTGMAKDRQKTSRAAEI